MEFFSAIVGINGKNIFSPGLREWGASSIGGLCSMRWMMKSPRAPALVPAVLEESG
jgi:hypothetical protein